MSPPMAGESEAFDKKGEQSRSSAESNLGSKIQLSTRNQASTFTTERLHGYLRLMVSDWESEKGLRTKWRAGSWSCCRKQRHAAH